MAYAEALQALGDPTRRSVLEQLRDGPRAVGEIAARLPVSRPAVSQHLRVLKEAGLVTERRNGTRRLYRVDPDGLAELREYLDGFWEETGASASGAACSNGSRRAESCLRGISGRSGSTTRIPPRRRRSRSCSSPRARARRVSSSSIVGSRFTAIGRTSYGCRCPRKAAGA